MRYATDETRVDEECNAMRGDNDDADERKSKEDRE